MAVNSYKQDEHSTDVGKMKTLMRLFSYLLDYKKEILAVLAIMAFCVFVSLVNPLIMENAIDKHISTGDFPGLADAFIGFAACGITGENQNCDFPCIRHSGLIRGFRQPCQGVNPF